MPQKERAIDIDSEEFKKREEIVYKNSLIRPNTINKLSGLELKDSYYMNRYFNVWNRITALPKDVQI